MSAGGFRNCWARGEAGSIGPHSLWPHQEKETSMSYFEHLPAVHYEGPQSDNPLAYRHYDRDKLVLGKRMEDHLRLAVCYWHTFVWPGVDMFGQGTFHRPWQQ